jgi:hypothetical protein
VKSYGRHRTLQTPSTTEYRPQNGRKDGFPGATELAILPTLEGKSLSAFMVAAIQRRVERGK